MYTLIRVGYNPKLSDDFKSWIANKISPSMVSHDEDTCQYDIDEIEVTMKDYEERGKKINWNSNDVHLIAQCKKENIAYLEF